MTDATTIEREEAAPDDIGEEVAGMNLPMVPALAARQNSFLPVPVETLHEVALMLAGMPGLRPEFKDPENCMAIAYRASRWGIDPVFTAEMAYFTKNKAGDMVIGYMAQLVNAVILANAPFARRPRIVFGYGGDKKPVASNRFAKVYFWFRGEDEPFVTTTPTVGQIKVKNSPLWFSDCDQQLSFYGLRSAARRYCPDVMAGVYVPEELVQIHELDAKPRPPLFEEDEPIDAEVEEGPPPQVSDTAPQSTGRDNEPPPIGDVEQDGLAELRAWIDAEESRLLAMTDHVVITEAWTPLIRDPRWGKLKAYDQARANEVKAKVFRRIDDLKAQ